MSEISVEEDKQISTKITKRSGYSSRDIGISSIILLTIFVVPSSISGIAIVLPAIDLDIHMPLANLHWVVNAFNLTFACFTLAWGALSDLWGRKRCFLIGTGLYSIASLLSLAANDGLTLDLARGLAGIGAAAVFSCGLSILSTHFEGEARLRVFSLFGTIAGLGVSLGPTMSGVLLDHFGWRAIFGFHALALAAALLGGSLLPKGRGTGSEAVKFDFLGATLFISALLALMTAIVQGSQWGWDSNGVLTLIAISVLVFAVFVVQERRVSRPMLDLTLLGNGPFLGFSLVTVAGSFGFVTLLTYLPTYLRGVLGLSPTEAGESMLLLTAPMLVCPLLAGKLVAIGVRANSVVISSLFCLIGGVIGLAMLSAPDVSLWRLAAPALLVGVGFGLAAGLVDGLALKFVPDEQAGMAAGLLNTFRLGSEAVAVSLYASLLTTLLYNRLHAPLQTHIPDLLERKTFIDSVASGNLDALSTSALANGATVHLHAVEGYVGAFHGVLWFLGASVVILTILVMGLIRPRTPA